MLGIRMPETWKDSWVDCKLACAVSSWCIRDIVASLASFAIIKAWKQNIPVIQDSTICGRTSKLNDLINDSASPFCHCSYAARVIILETQTFEMICEILAFQFRRLVSDYYLQLVSVSYVSYVGYAFLYHGIGLIFSLKPICLSVH
jgi:hypothetical protein